MYDNVFVKGDAHMYVSAKDILKNIHESVKSIVTFLVVYFFLYLLKLFVYATFLSPIFILLFLFLGSYYFVWIPLYAVMVLLFFLSQKAWRGFDLIKKKEETP